MKCNKSELIKAGVREGFWNGNSKYATRRCYGYDIMRHAGDYQHHHCDQHIP